MVRYINGRKMTKVEDYTIPITKYKYRKLSWDDYMSNRYNGYRTVRSSIIPVTYSEEKNLWLLGSFHDYPKDILADFGGSCVMWEPPARKGESVSRQEKNRQSPFGCVMIEIYEESKGLLVKPILKALGSFQNKFINIWEGLDYKRKERVIFTFVPVNYDELLGIPYKFSKLSDNSYEKLGPLDFYSEDDIFNRKWKLTRNLSDFVDFLNKL